MFSGLRVVVLALFLCTVSALPAPIPESDQAAVRAQMYFEMPVFTATREYRTTTDVPPYIITATTTITWTQSSTTTIAQPTGPGHRAM